MLNGSENQTSTVKLSLKNVLVQNRDFFKISLMTWFMICIYQKKSAEMIATRVKQRHCLQFGVTITSLRPRKQDFLPYFTEEEPLVFCNKVSELLI